MNDLERCPDCGHENPPQSATCSNCGFPLRPEAIGAPLRAPEVAAAPPPQSATPEPAPIPFRPRRRPPRGSNEALSLWLVFGTLMALAVLFVAVKANVDRARPAVEGASAPQQALADSLREAIESDSTNVDARVRLGDVLYDTGNWTEAIVHYRSAVRQDSGRVNALVDLGVCYYNLGDSPQAERLFHLALQRDPSQPIALFNLGIVHERRDDVAAALEYYRRSLQTDPPAELRQAIIEAMGRAQQKSEPGKAGG